MLIARHGFNARAVAGGQARRVGTASTNVLGNWTALNTTVTKTDVAKFGTASMYCPLVTSDIQSPTNPSFMNYGTGEFSIEWWMYIPTLSGHSASCDLLSLNVTGGLGLRLAQAFNTNGLSSANPKYINLFARGQADLDYWTLTSNWAINTWYFCALQRKGTTMSFWLNGVLQTRSGSGGGTRSFASALSTTRARIGRAETASGSTGAGPIYIDEICYSNTYRYDDPAAAIAIPAAAFTVDTYTTQLLHMDGANNGTSFPNATS